ncbi:hypothetical protein BpHYR1_015604 [Brachionus plicatilis]|uniref:Uncharacterized protein n=1 Tax=Brachionus plicatilis TaxID=10195 RepID=A0A3M7PSG1_BRAPC|nr:hypothetical protein BpHYR1_015604 [Brachionus plicatilis]
MVHFNLVLHFTANSMYLKSIFKIAVSKSKLNSFKKITYIYFSNSLIIKSLIISEQNQVSKSTPVNILLKC